MNIVKPVRIVIVALAAVTVLSACAAQTAQIPTAALPAGKAWAEGKEIYFVHTEASDAGIAEKLTNMMKSPVFHVPSLAKTPAEGLAPVYVFENGVTGKGPLGLGRRLSQPARIRRLHSAAQHPSGEVGGPDEGA